MKTAVATLLFIAVLAPRTALAEESACPRPAEALALVKAVDKVFYSDTRETMGRLEIDRGGRTRIVRMHSYVQGNRRAFTEVLAPERDKGSKFLKIDDELWIYTPEADQIIKIAKHMLRQGMMGSDYSYEDALEESKLEDLYALCWLDEKDPAYPDSAVIELTAKPRDLTYYRRRLVIDPRTSLLHKEERFARSGKMLKVMTVDAYTQFNGVPYPKQVTMKDLLRTGSKTVMVTEDVKVNVKLPENIFSRQALRR